MDESCGVRSCTRCPELVESRSRIVNGTGPTDADVLLVGEAPGADEDAEGEPFVGRSGDILDETLAAVELDRSAVRITNCVRCRPPENRDPTGTELANCRTYLEAEIEAVDPAVVVPLGKVPSEHLLERSVAVTSESGAVASVTVNEREWPAVICVHPAAALYNGRDTGPLEAGLAKAASLAGDQRTLSDL